MECMGGCQEATGSGSRKRKYVGVQERLPIVGVKKWYMRSDLKWMSFYRSVNMSAMHAAVLHDLVILHANQDFAKQLSIDDVVQDIQDPALMVDLKGRGREWLVQWVEGKPLKHKKEDWEKLDEGQKEELKQEIEDQVPGFLVFLEEKIACECSKAGRQRTDLEELLDPVEENDPIQELNEATGSGSRKRKYVGVQERLPIVEVKKWYMRSDLKWMSFYRSVNMSAMHAAVLHDLVILHANQDFAKQLSIDDVVQDIQDPALMVDLKGRGREWLVQWVEGKPLKHKKEDWEKLDEGQKEELKQEIEDQVPGFLVFLEEKIACECSKAGRQRTDLEELLDPVEENDPIQELNERDEALKDMNAAQKGRDIVMEEQYAVKEAARAASVNPSTSGVAEREEFPQTQETQDPNGTCGYAAGKNEIAFSNVAIGAKNVAPKEPASCEGIALPEPDPDLDIPSLPNNVVLLQDESNSDSESWMLFVDWK